MELTNERSKSFPWFLIAAIAAIVVAIGFFSGDSMDLVMVSGNFETTWEPYTETMISDSLGRFFWYVYCFCFYVGSILYIPGWCVLIAALFTLVFQPMKRILLGAGALCLSGFWATHFCGMVVYKIAEVVYCKAHLSETSVASPWHDLEPIYTINKIPILDLDSATKAEVDYIPDYTYTYYGYDYEAGAKLTYDEILPIIVCFFTALAFAALLAIAILYIVRQTGKITKIVGLLPAILCGASILVNVLGVLIPIVGGTPLNAGQSIIDMFYAWIPLFIMFLSLWLGLLFGKRDTVPVAQAVTEAVAEPEQAAES